MEIDVLRFLALPDETAHAKYSRQHNARGQFKADSTDIITPIDSSGYGQWKHIKNKQGWPWDLALYDEKFVYDWVTEGKNGWSNDPNVGPKSFKKFVQNHAALNSEAADGLVMFPRYVDTVQNEFSTTILPYRTKYATFENCIQVGNIVSLGKVKQTLEGPFQIDHGGDVKTQPTLIAKYYWNDNGTDVLEENYYALDFGWISWKLQKKNNSTGFYDLASETVEPFIFPAEAKIVFPCF